VVMRGIRGQSSGEDKHTEVYLRIFGNNEDNLALVKACSFW
jgi:hypothetical protein